MKYWHCVISAALCCLSGTAIVHADESGYTSQDCCEPQYCESECRKLTYSPFRINVDQIGGDNENGAVELFSALPSLINECWLPFVDLKWHHLGSSNSWAANAGVGLRCLDPWDRTIGINVFYDHRYSRETEFNQIGFGLESLGEIIDVRINGYFPFKKTTETAVLFNDYIGDYFVEASQEWLSMTGFDLELGCTVFNNGLFGIYAAAGPYYYYNTQDELYFPRKNFWGGMARIAVQCTDYLSLEVKASYDTMFKTKVQGELQLTLPFEKCFELCKWTSDACANIFLKPVERREVIVLHHSDILWLGNY